MHVVWPEHTDASFWRTGYEVHPSSAEDLAADLEEAGYPFCKWEERFTICEMHAILHMLEHLAQDLPSPVRRMLLRRADQFPLLHGQFAPYNGRLGFHAEEGEIIGPGECWRVLPNGEREQLW